MEGSVTLTYEVPGDDFTRAGEAASDIKMRLKKMGIDPVAVRKTSISLYEGEINMIIHAGGGNITVTISPSEIVMVLEDHGPGIPDVEQAMQEGFSTASDTIRDMGFGAGMGLPNMKKYTDELDIDTKVGSGTTVTMVVYV